MDKHKLLKRQLKKFMKIRVEEDIPDNWRRFLRDVSEAYEESDKERRLLERIQDTNAEEINRYMEKEKEFELVKSQLTMMESFERFVPKQFLDCLGKQDIRDVNIGDAMENDLTILFTDLRSFTAISEKMTSEDNFNFLNEYLTYIGPSILEHDGFIDKFIGDAIMALFLKGDHGDHGLQSAIAMSRALNSLNTTREGRGESPIYMGLGLHTGHCMLGTVGFEDRMDTTVIGDSVNLASRLESLTKEMGAEILVSDSLMDNLNASGAYHTRVVGKVKVAGKDLPVRVHEVYDAEPEEVVAGKDSTREEFASSLSAYQCSKFDQAITGFQSCIEACAEDTVALKYIDRCRFLIGTPPPANWEGVTVIPKG